MTGLAGPVLILTYGKVASTSLRNLLGERFPGDVLYSHGRQPGLLEPWQAFAATAPERTEGIRAAAFGDNAEIERRLALAREAGHGVTIVTGVRDPVARGLSAALEVLDSLLPECRADSLEATADRIAQRVRELWTVDLGKADPALHVAAFAVQAPLSWLRTEIEEPFGFDVLSGGFDTAAGYQVLAHGADRLLVFRVEDAPGAVEAGLAELLPGELYRLPRENATAGDVRAELYALVKQRFRLPGGMLERIYANPYVNRFYTAAEIEAAKARWLEERVPAQAAAPVLRATVVLTLGTGVADAEAQVQAVLAQWRPELELLVVDGGPRAASEAVRRALAGRPDVAAVTVDGGGAPGLAALLPLVRTPVVILAGEDEVSLAGWFDAVLGCFGADPRCRLVSANGFGVSPEGVVTGVLDSERDDGVFADPLAAGQDGGQQGAGCGLALHRSLIEAFPAVPEAARGDAALLRLRAALAGTHRYLAEPLLLKRQPSRRLDADPGGALLAAAQRLRDVHMYQAGAADPAAVGPVAAATAGQLLDAVTRWGATMATGGGARVAAIPPVATLLPGVRQLFGRHGSLGAVASAWNGFHLGEDDRTWTGRRAALGLRAPGASVIRIGLGGREERGATCPGRARVLGGSWVDAGPGVATEVTLAPPSRGEILTLCLDAPGAGMGDRQSGLCLLWIEAG